MGGPPGGMPQQPPSQFPSHHPHHPQNIGNPMYQNSTMGMIPPHAQHSGMYPPHMQDARMNQRMYGGMMGHHGGMMPQQPPQPVSQPTKKHQVLPKEVREI